VEIYKTTASYIKLGMKNSTVDSPSKTSAFWFSFCSACLLQAQFRKPAYLLRRLQWILAARTITGSWLEIRCVDMRPKAPSVR